MKICKFSVINYWQELIRPPKAATVSYGRAQPRSKRGKQPACHARGVVAPFFRNYGRTGCPSLPFEIPIRIFNRTRIIPLIVMVAGILTAVPIQAEESEMFTLVKDGKPAVTIVTAAQPSSSAKHAVKEFQYFLTRLTGTNLPVKTDAETVECPVVLIGASKALEKYGVDAGTLKYDNFLIRSGTNFLAIVGRDTEMPGSYNSAIGTANGVYAFLEDYCGVRVFMPGENGIIAPKTATLAVPANLNVNFQKSMLVGMVPFGTAELRYRWRCLPGLRAKMSADETWSQAIPVKTYFQEHPEYFALVKGKRSDHLASSLCISNPDVLRLTIEWCKEQLKDYDIIEIEQPDSYGGSVPACECEKCVALGKTLGNRVCWFHTKVAEALYAWNPSKKLTMIAYGPTAYTSPDRKLPDNVIAEICFWSVEAAPERFEVWSKAVNQFSVYVYFWSPYAFGFGPASSIREVVDAFGLYKRHNVNMCYYCTKPLNWGIIAPQLYLDYRLRMNYDADPKKVLADFYSGLYGPAAGAMKTFFDFVDAAQNTPIQGEKKNLAANRYLSQWPVGKAEEALKLLDQADAAAGNDSVIKGRIELSRVSIGYIRENSRCFDLERKYKQSGTVEDLESLAKACAERETWIDGILKKQDEKYYTEKLGLVDPFPASYRKEGTVRDQVIYGKSMAGHGLRGGPFDMDFKSKLAFLRQHPKIVEGKALKADGAPKIDGILDEAVWAKAPKMGLLKDDGSGAAPVPADIQLAYDQNAVYVAFTVHEPAIDKMEKKPAEVAKKERAYLEDCVEVFLGESGKDARKWVHMIVSFTNARYDGRFGFVTDPLDPLSSNPDNGWTAPWESAVKVDAEKKQWTVELAIPWSTLGFGAPQTGTCLQANFARYRWTDQGPKGAADLSAWSPTFGKGLEDASRFGSVKLDN